MAREFIIGRGTHEKKLLRAFLRNKKVYKFQLDKQIDSLIVLISVSGGRFPRGGR